MCPFSACAHCICSFHPFSPAQPAALALSALRLQGSCQSCQPCSSNSTASPATSCPQAGMDFMLCVVSAMPRALRHGWDPGFGRNYTVFVSKVKVKTLRSWQWMWGLMVIRHTPATRLWDPAQGLLSLSSCCQRLLTFSLWRSCSVLSSGHQNCPSVTSNSPMSTAVLSRCQKTTLCCCSSWAILYPVVGYGAAFWFWR